MLAFLLLAPALAPPPVTQPPSVAEFLARADSVSAKGDAASGSPELAALKAEVRRITIAYRADLARARAVGEPPHSCPPERSGLTSSNLLAELNQVPPEARATTSVRDVYRAMMKKRYPCP